MLLPFKAFKLISFSLTLLILLHPPQRMCQMTKVRFAWFLFNTLKREEICITLSYSSLTALTELLAEFVFCFFLGLFNRLIVLPTLVAGIIHANFGVSSEAVSTRSGSHTVRNIDVDFKRGECDRGLFRSRTNKAVGSDESKLRAFGFTAGDMQLILPPAAAVLRPSAFRK